MESIKKAVGDLWNGNYGTGGIGEVEISQTNIYLLKLQLFRPKGSASRGVFVQPVSWEWFFYIFKCLEERSREHFL